MNFAVVRRHYCERFTASPHAYFSGKIPITAYIVDEITIEIIKKTKEVIMPCFFLQKHKVLKIKVCQNGDLLDHEVLTVRQQQIPTDRLKLMNLKDSEKELVYPIKIQLDREYQAGERVQLTIETISAFRLIPEKKDFFLPCIEFIPLSSKFLDLRYWPKRPNSADSSISHVLPKGLKAVSMTSEGPDFMSELEGNSFIGWVFRGEKFEYLRHWFVARISLIYFLLLYLVIPSFGFFIIISDCLKMSVPPTIIAMLCGSYFVARYYLHDKTLMTPGGDSVIGITFASSLLSVVSDIDLVLLIINIFVFLLPWIAFGFGCLGTRQNRKKNDELLGYVRVSRIFQLMRSLRARILQIQQFFFGPIQHTSD